MKKNKTTIKLYSESGQFIKDTDVEYLYSLNAVKSKSMLDKNIRSALTGYKGYGFYEGYFISYNDVYIMTPEEEMVFFGKWCIDNLHIIKKSLMKQKGEFERDIWADLLLNICEQVQKTRGVNKPENFLTFKYRTLKLDAFRKTKRNKAQLISSNRLVTSDDSNELTITDVATESVWSEPEDNGGIDLERCTKDVNEMKLFEIVVRKLQEQFNEQSVEIYLFCKTSLNKGIVRLASEKFGVSILKIRQLLKLMQESIESCKDEMLIELELIKYPTIDELTLNHIINN